MPSTSAVNATCTANCRTFLWGGAGEPMYDDGGICWCSCDNDGWSTVNIIGRPSCVPVAAHLTLGWVGLCFAVVGVFHAAFHLHRQVRFHKEQTSAGASPIEQCRRQLHITALLAATLTILYFSLVVRNELWLSTIALSVLQIPVCISIGALSTRMWIYTNDRRVLQKSPEVLRISRWLETRKGHYVAYSLLSIAPVGAIILSAVKRAEEAVKLISVGIVMISIYMTIAFWICGRSLLKGINESLRQQQQKEEQLQEMGVLRKNGKGVGRDAALLTARKKVKMVVIFAIATLTKVICLLLFSIFSPYGVEAPLLLFISPMTLIPPLWNIANVMIHRGRTRTSPGSFFSRHAQSRVAALSPSYAYGWRSHSPQNQCGRG